MFRDNLGVVDNTFLSNDECYIVYLKQSCIIGVGTTILGTLWYIYIAISCSCTTVPYNFPFAIPYRSREGAWTIIEGEDTCTHQLKIHYDRQS